MARKLTEDEQTMLEDALTRITSEFSSRYGRTFREEAVETIMDTTLPKVHRIKADMDQLAHRLWTMYTNENDVSRLYDGSSATTVTATLPVPKGLTHRMFPMVKAYVEMDEPVYLYGPAGTGKNHLVKQVAEDLGLGFYFSGAVTQEHKFTGYMDAMGRYVPTQFYEAFTKGGVFFLDEMDASAPEVLVLLNSAIANRYFDFPCGKVEANPEFRVVAAGNTLGTGSSYEYTGRNQLDCASLNRFAVVEIDYDYRIEMAVSGSNEELVAFVHDYRQAVSRAGLPIAVSYREISRVAKMEPVIGVKEAIRSGLDKHMAKGDRDSVIGYLQRKENRYAKVLMSL